jgi:hypothetical protein
LVHLNDHKFYNLIETSFDNKLSDSPSCDESLLEYLKEMSDKTNRNYFQFIFKFVFLFREFFNKQNINESEDIDYSSVNGAGALPDFCNDYVIEFLEPKDYYGMDSGELIECIQHLCYWLYSKKYTTSRLKLL